MDAHFGADDRWILTGIAYLLFRVVGRVEALEKAVEKLLGNAQKTKDDDSPGK